MWYGHHGFHFFPFLLMLLVIFMIIRMIAFRKHGRWCHAGPDGRMEADAILKRRLASGEINEEEYQRLKDVLSK